MEELNQEITTQILQKHLPKDTVILTAGCAKYKYNKLNLRRYWWNS